MNTNFIRRALLLFALSLASVLQAEPALAGHPGFKGQTLDADSIKAVLLGKKVTVGDTRVIIIVAKTGAAQDAFLQAQVGMSTSQFQNHWRRLFMTGGGSAPKIVETEDEASKLAASTPGAVAIVDKGKAEGLTILAQ